MDIAAYVDALEGEGPLLADAALAASPDVAGDGIDSLLATWRELVQVSWR